MGRLEDTYGTLAARRGLELIPPTQMAPLTPLLAMGGQLNPVARGEVGRGFAGMVGHLVYGSSEGSGSFRFNIAHVRVPESQATVPRLFCIRRGRWTDTTHYGMEIRHSEVWTESQKLNERFQVQTGLFQDANWMRQLFSPVFIDWLASAQPQDFSFELAYGDLVGSIEQDEPDEATLDALCEATSYVAERIRDECLEPAVGAR